jgi:hypothetical protein
MYALNYNLTFAFLGLKLPRPQLAPLIFLVFGGVPLDLLLFFQFMLPGFTTNLPLGPAY